MNKRTTRIEEFIFIISCLLIIIGIIWQANINLKADVTPSMQIQNMLAAPPLPANTYLENYSLYVPQGYDVKIVDSTIIVYNKQSTVTFYLGQGVELSSQFFDSMNPKLEKIYGQSTTIDDDVIYTYAWQYDQDYIEILLGQNDSYIAAIYPQAQLDVAITDITLMFNSYQVIND